MFCLQSGDSIWAFGISKDKYCVSQSALDILDLSEFDLTEIFLILHKILYLHVYLLHVLLHVCVHLRKLYITSINYASIVITTSSIFSFSFTFSCLIFQY